MAGSNMKLIFITLISTILWINTLQERPPHKNIQHVDKLKRALDMHDHERETKAIQMKDGGKDEDDDEYEDEELAVLHRGKRSPYPRMARGGGRKPSVSSRKPSVSSSKRVIISDTQRRKGNPSAKVAAAAGGGAVVGGALGSSGGCSGCNNGHKKKSDSTRLYGIKELLSAVFVVGLAVIYHVR